MNAAAANPIQGAARVALGALAAVGLSLVSLYSYLLFHSLVEIFTVTVAGGIFMVAWNSRRLLDNNYLLFVGISSLFVAAIDLVHALAYKDMGVFPGAGPDVPTQLWIAARYLQSLSLLAAPLFLERRLRPGLVVAGYAGAVALVFGSIFAWRIFPSCFVEGAGLTPFKVGSEYAISLLFLASLLLLLRNRSRFEPRVLRLLCAAILLLVVAELAFTFYVSVFGLSNMVGHLAKAVAFYLVYMALVETGLARPYELLFRELKLSEERYRHLYDATPVMLHSVDREGRLTSVSAYWLDYLGYRRDEVIGRRPSEFFTEDSRRRAEEDILPEFFRQGSVRDVHYRVVRKGGEVIDVLMTASVERDAAGEFVRSLAVMVDVTERKRAEEAVNVLNAQLQARAVELEEANCELQTALETVEETNTELETALDDLAAVNLELETSNRELDAFNRTVSHDLRSPLTGIMGFAELLANLPGVTADSRHTDYVRHIALAAKRMDQLIGALLEFSRAAHCDLRRETVDLSAEAREIAAELQAREPERKVTFRVLDGITAEGDPRLLRVVLANLIGNAWKYTGNNDSAVIEFGRTETGAGTACFVRDDGPGFEPGEAEKLFHPFHRLPGAAGFAGHGIGLTTVQRIVQRHGGTVWGESEPGKGAAFFFTL